MKALIGANVAVFLLTAIVPSLRLTLGLVPIWVVHDLRLWQLVTYMFVHGGVFHILFNMLALWMFGAELERLWGTRFFVKFYFVTGVGAGILTVLFSLLPFEVAQQLYISDVIGASGAIYGLLLAYGMYFPDRPIYMYFSFPIPARIFVLIMGALAFYASFSETGGGIANATHLSGLLVAYVYLKNPPRPPARRAEVPVCEVEDRSDATQVRRPFGRPLRRSRRQQPLGSPRPLTTADC